MLTPFCFVICFYYYQVRLQVQSSGPRLYNGMFDCILKVSRQEGPKALYKGMSPALLRQASYSSIRMGIYEPIRNLISSGKPADQITFFERTLAGGTAGALGIMIANPTDLIKIRYVYFVSGLI